MSSQLFVGRLSYNATEDQVRDFFNQYAREIGAVEEDVDAVVASTEGEPVKDAKGFDIVPVKIVDNEKPDPITGQMRRRRFAFVTVISPEVAKLIADAAEAGGQNLSIDGRPVLVKVSEDRPPRTQGFRGNNSYAGNSYNNRGSNNGGGYNSYGNSDRGGFSGGSKGGFKSRNKDRRFSNSSSDFQE